MFSSTVLAMTERDVLVGQALGALRGDRAQSQIADEMRQRGWKWSQATVWSVEKGERPLRLLEAGDLADILGVQIEDFFGDRAAARQEAEFRRLQGQVYDAAMHIRRATERLLAARSELRDWADSVGISVPEDYETASNYPRDSREMELFMSFHWKTPSKAVAKGEQSYASMRDKKAILRRGYSVPDESSEKNDGIDPEEA